MKYLVMIVFALLLTGCDSGTPIFPFAQGTIATMTMDANAWSFRYSAANVPAHPTQRNAEQWEFEFPPSVDTKPNGVHYLIHPVTGRIASKAITARVFAQGTMREVEPCGDTNVARVSIQRCGDNLSGAGAYEHYRWWSIPNLVLSEITEPTDFVVAIGPSQWSSVYGKTGDQAPDGFATMHVTSGAPEQVRHARTVGHETAGRHILLRLEHSRQPVLR
jgi:hypothetical protein